VNRQQCIIANSIFGSWKVLVMIVILGTMTYAQNPVPQIVGSVKPTAVAPGGGAFTLTVYGANFVSGAVVNWNYQPRSTTFVSARELQAQILATDIAAPTAGTITVTNPAPGGGNSSASFAQVEVHAPTATINPGPPMIVKAVKFPYGGGPPLIADINGDNKLDFVFGSVATLGKGDGTFKFSQILRWYLPPRGLAYGDFNGDGKMDIAYVAGALDVGNGQQITMALGDGTGRFKLGSPLRTYAYFGWVMAGDFNGDGKLDIAVIRKDVLAVFLGNGDGTFQTPLLNPLPGSHESGQTVTGDFNGDGKLDILWVDSTTGVYLALGKGDGTFQSPWKLVTSGSGWGCPASEAQTVLVDDFNGDGKLDFVACNQATGNEIGVFLGNGDGTFQQPLLYPLPHGQWEVASGDFNSDGKLDLLITGSEGLVNTNAIMLGNGDGTFQAQQTVSSFGAYTGAQGVATADFNADGLLDFAFINGGGVPVVFTQQ
jgi:hypothetical protein